MKYLDLFPKPLKDSIIQNRCLPIIGSGFSLNANIPEGHKMLAWKALGDAFAEEMPGYDCRSTIDAISAYEYAFSRPVMAEKMKDFLLAGLITPAATHEAFCRLQFDIVCTTNFDHLLEDGYSKIGKPCRSIISESQLSVAPMKGELTLLKFHGDIDHPDKMVATEEDYDKFLNQNPTLATYLSSLLITRTPLFIGYSLDDEDFRQIWQVVKNRLGKMTRQGYVIKVNCSESERRRYERRGIDVINLEGSSYSSVLTELFEEIKSYWDENTKTYGDNSAMSELILPKGTRTRLCFISAPFSDLPYYKDIFFPIAQKYGFTPITADAIVSSSDNWMAKVSSLISKSDFFIVDLSSQYTFYEFSQMIAMKKVKDSILLIKDDDYQLPQTNSYQYISKKELLLAPDQCLLTIDSWFKKQAAKYSKSSELEPERLLKKNEYNAAIISAVIQLEVTLRRLLEEKTGNGVFAKGIFELARIAKDNGFVMDKDFNKMRQWITLRNQLVHSEMEIDEKTASNTVDEIVKYIEALKTANR